MPSFGPITHYATMYTCFACYGALFTCEKRDILYWPCQEEKPIKIFEVGDIILLNSKVETGAERELHLAAVVYHDDADFTEIRSTLDFIMTGLGKYDKYEVKAGTNSTYIDGRYGDIYLDGIKIGEIGEIHPLVLTNFKLEFPVAALELNLQKFL